MTQPGVAKVAGGFMSGLSGLAGRLRAYSRGRQEQVRGAALEALEGRQLMTLAPVGPVLNLVDGGHGPAIAVAGDGSFDVAWTAMDKSGAGVFVQRFSALGLPETDLVRVNTQEENAQFEVDIARSGDGTFMVVWTTLSEEAGKLLDVHGQLFDADGEKVGTEFAVNGVTLGNQQKASVTALPSSSDVAADGFLVTWMSIDDEGQSIQGQVYSHTGAAVGDAFTVGTVAIEGNTLMSPKVGAADDGSFVVGWQELEETKNSVVMYGQRFKSDGEKTGEVFTGAQAMATFADGAATVPTYDMAVAGDGYVVFTYDNYNFEGQNWDVMAQVVSHENLPDFAAFMVNDTVLGDQFHSSVTFKSDSTILVTWEGKGSINQQNGQVVFARRFVGTGIGGPELTVSGQVDGFGEGLYPQMGRHSDSGFAVAWNGFGALQGQNVKVLGRVFDDVVAGPSALVTGNGLVIANGSTTTSFNDLTSFGVVTVGGQQVLHTFRVTNTGTQELVTKNLIVPQGFGLVEGLSEKIAPGGFDEITIALLTQEVGSLSKVVSFGVNMGNVTTYAFTISGEVQQAQSTGVYIINKNTAKGDRIFIDDNNNRVTFNYTGAGSAKLTTDPVTKKFLSIELTGTDPKTGLTIDVNAKGNSVGKNGTATGTGTGAGSVGLITIAGGMRSFSAKEMSLSGDFVAQGFVKTVMLGNVGSGEQHVFTLNGTNKERASISLGQVKDITFTSAGMIDTLRVVRWDDNVGVTDVITAPVIDTLKVIGIKQTKAVAGVVGDFEATLKLSGAGLTKPILKTLGTLDIAGSWVGSAEKENSVAGTVGTINVDGDWLQGSLHLSAINGTPGSVGKLGSITVDGQVTASTLFVPGSVTSFKAGEWDGGLLSALSVGTFTITGRSSSYGQVVLAGNMRGDLAVNPDNLPLTGNVLGTFSVAGKVSDSVVRVKGNTGAITFKGADSVLFTATGKVLSFTSTGQVLGDSVLESSSEIGAIKAINWLGGEILAQKVLSLSISGAFKIAENAYAPNNFTAAVSLGTVGGVSLGNVGISGTVTGGAWETKGSVGAMTVGAMGDINISIGGGLTSFTSKSEVMAGVQLKVAGMAGAISARSWDGGYIEAAKIGTITTTGVKKAGTTPATPGNFSANVSATGAGYNLTGKTKPVLIAGMNVDGRLGTGGEGFATVTSMGRMGAVKAGSLLNASINAADDLTSVSSQGTAENVRITAGQRLGAVTSINWLGGEITAQQITSITIKGQKASKNEAFISGDFTGTVTAVGTPGGPVKLVDLGAVTVAGNLGILGMSGAHFNVLGKMGAVTAGAIGDTTISLGGALASITSKGLVSGLTVIAGVMGEDTFTGGAVGAVSVGAIANSVFHTGKMTSLSVTGRKASASAGPEIIGNASGLTLTIEDSTAKAGTLMLGGLTVAGALTDSKIRVSDNTGNVSVGSISNSNLYVGVKSTFDEGLPESFTAFERLSAKLTGFAVTGKGVASDAASFVNSNVAAGQLVNVSLKLVAAVESEATFGLAAGSKIGTYKRLLAAGSTATKNVTNVTAPETYDEPEGTTFVLRIVTRPPGMFI